MSTVLRGNDFQTCTFTQTSVADLRNTGSTSVTKKIQTPSNAREAV